MVLLSHAAGCVGTTPLGDAHSTTLTEFVLSGAAKAELAGMTRLTCCPLEKGMPAVNGLCGCAASEMMEPLVRPVAPAPTLRPNVTKAAMRSATPDSWSTVQDLRCPAFRRSVVIRTRLFPTAALVPFSAVPIPSVARHP